MALEKASFDLFCSALDASPNPMFAGAGRCFQYLNPAALRLFGAHSAEQLLAQPVIERVHPDDQAVVAQRIGRLKHDTAILAPHRHRYLRLDGTTVHVETSAVPYRFGGEPGGFVFVRAVAQGPDRVPVPKKRSGRDDRRANPSHLLLDRYFRTHEDALGPGALAPEEEHELSRSAAAGDFAARSQLLAEHMGLVVHIAKGYAGPDGPLQELIRQGNTALTRALQTFDPERGIRFSVFAGWQIISGIEWAQGQAQSRIRLPGIAVREINACIRVRRYLDANGYREPSAEALAYVIGSPVGRVRQILALHERMLRLEACAA
ncbi:MAG: PAS domain-containing protein [Betaproteobacteria bacterium]|nr:PAS domain-containing protein [Betaproteobacteria bacterium]